MLLHFLYILLLFNTTQSQEQYIYQPINQSQKHVTSKIPKSKWSFVDYLAKFDPHNVWEKLNIRQKLSGKPFTNESYVEAMYAGIDMTDELLNLRVADGSTRVPVQDDGRRWRPPRGYLKFKGDPFGIRPRIYELMKQTIYQARNKMVIMQIFRKKYQKKALYKMGYLFSKTDNACQIFSKFAYNILRACSLVRQGLLRNTHTYDLLIMEERLLNLWFNVELLIDLINKNDAQCKETLEQYPYQIEKHWKFID